MSPMYCDYSGELIEAKHAKFGKSPELGSDYFAFLDKLISAKAKEEIEQVVKETMEKQKVYKKETYDQVFRQVISQHCNAKPKR